MCILGGICNKFSIHSLMHQLSTMFDSHQYIFEKLVSQNVNFYGISSVNFSDMAAAIVRAQKAMSSSWTWNAVCWCHCLLVLTGRLTHLVLSCCKIQACCHNLLIAVGRSSNGMNKDDIRVQTCSETSWVQSCKSCAVLMVACITMSIQSLLLQSSRIPELRCTGHWMAWHMKFKLVSVNSNILHTGKPSYAAELVLADNSRSSFYANLHVSHTNLSFASHLFLIAAPTVWSSPFLHMFILHLNSFQKRLKIYLLQSAFNNT